LACPVQSLSKLKIIRFHGDGSLEIRDSPFIPSFAKKNKSFEIVPGGRTVVIPVKDLLCLLEVPHVDVVPYLLIFCSIIFSALLLLI
jgi:hypothetical protein